MLWRIPGPALTWVSTASAPASCSGGAPACQRAWLAESYWTTAWWRWKLSLHPRRRGACTAGLSLGKHITQKCTFIIISNNNNNYNNGLYLYSASQGTQSALHWFLINQEELNVTWQCKPLHCSDTSLHWMGGFWLFKPLLVIVSKLRKDCLHCL